MIGTALSYVADDLNSYISRILGVPPGQRRVALTTLVNPDGSLALNDRNILTLSLVNIAEEGLAGHPNGKIFPRHGGAMESPPFQLNLHILISAFFEESRTRDALDTLTFALNYFQGKSVHDPQNSPTLPKGVDKLVFELETLDFMQLSHLWGVLGAKLMPSILLKVRMLTINEEKLLELYPSITGLGMQSKPQ